MTLQWSVVWNNLGRLGEGAELTVILAVVTMALAVPGGLLLAFLRLSRFGLVRGAATAFVEFFRATPLILQIYWVYYVLPVFSDILFPPIATALIGLVCNISSFNSETFRAGILSIRQGQWNAGLALGMSRRQVMLRIVLPQAAMRVLPSLASTWVSLFKDTSLVSVIAVGELAHVALQIRSQSFRVLEMLTAMAAIYWLLGYPQAKLVDWIQKKFEVKE
jgi:His/Glu/Gln/Arg/opine family amino acid ABC transporter permease subunit